MLYRDKKQSSESGSANARGEIDINAQNDKCVKLGFANLRIESIIPIQKQ